VREAFERSGYSGHLVMAPVISEDERVFLLAPADMHEIGDVRVLEEQVQQILRRKVWVVERTAQWGEPVPFE
jgi:hypothetical protein